MSSSSNTSSIVVVNVNAAAWNELELLSLEVQQESSPTYDSSIIEGSSTISCGSSVENSRRAVQSISTRFEYCWNAVLQFVSMLSIGWDQTKVTLIAVHSTNR